MAPCTRFVLAALCAFVTTIASGTASADEAHTKQLFQLCAQCHGSAGQGNPEALAPAIAGLQEWYVKAQLENFRAGKRGMHPQDVGGLRMYPMSLSLENDEEIAALAAYVASLPPVYSAPLVEGGDPQKGATSYVVCTACHGPDGAGNEALGAPRLTGSSDWYLVKQLEHFKSGIRGGAGASQNAITMRGMSMSLASEQAIKDVVAYIMTLRSE
jgi:cytochrome c553